MTFQKNLFFIYLLEVCPWLVRIQWGFGWLSSFINDKVHCVDIMSNRVGRFAQVIQEITC